MVSMRCWLNFRFSGLSMAGVPSAVSGPSSEVDPSSLHDAPALTAWLMQSVRSFTVWSAFMSVGVLVGHRFASPALPPSGTARGGALT